METKTEKPAIGLKRLVMWQLISDTETGVTYSEAPVKFDKKLMTATDTPTVTTGSLEADNQVVDEAVSHDGGELSIGVTALSNDERVLLYGETLDGGTLVDNKDNIGNYNATAYMTTRRDGLVNLYKYPKVMFTPQAENYSTVKKGSIEYAVASLKGNYIPTIANGNSAYRRLGVNPETESEIIEKWFTEADYYKPAE